MSLPTTTYANKGTPYFALAGSGGGGGGSNWSLYPALQTVDMSNFGLDNVSSITAGVGDLVLDGPGVVNSMIPIDAPQIITDSITSIAPITFEVNGDTNLTLYQSTAAITTASISSLTVSSINGVPPSQLSVADWSLYPAVSSINIDGNDMLNVSNLYSETGQPIYITTNGSNEIIMRTNGLDAMTISTNQKVVFSSDVNAPTVNARVINVSTISASTINTNILNATSTIHSISTISSSVLEVPSIVNLSSINGIPISSLGSPSDWSLFPAVSTVNMAGNNIGDVTNPSTLATNIIGANQVGSYGFDAFGNPGGLGNFDNQVAAGNNLAGLRLKAYIGSTTSFLQNTDNVFENGQEYIKTFEIDGVDYATMSATSSLGGWQFTDKGSNAYTMVDGTLTAPTISSVVLNVSTINGIEFSGGSGGSVTLSSVVTSALSSVTAGIAQGLMSSIVFNPSINPTFNLDLGVGNLLTSLGTGLFAVAVGVPTLAGTATYGITKGLASLFEPKPVNNITNNEFEVYNYQTQLQISTLPYVVSTVYTFLSTIPSTVVINDQPTNSTISSIDLPFFFSTVSGPNPTCIRSVADPTQTISTPWTYSQSLPEWGWTELPSSIGGGGGGNVSTLSLSTLVLAPSTLLKGDLPNTLEVLGLDGEYNQVNAQGFVAMNQPNDGNFGIFTRNNANQPVYLDSNFSTSKFALQGTDVAFNSVNFPVKDINSSTITSFFVDNVAEPELTYALYPPGFPSTTVGQIKFSSSLGGVQILSQLGTSKSLLVNSNGVTASDLVTGGPSDYPLVSLVPDLDEWSILGMSTISGGGVGRTSILTVVQSNTGQLAISAPNNSNGSSTRLIYLDSASTAVGINNPVPQAQLDVGLGLNYVSPGSLAAFAGNKDGTLEVTLQNQSAGSNASAFFFAVENTAGEYAGFGVNSLNLSNLYNTLFEIPGASIQSGTLDCVIGPQSDHSSNSGIYLTYQDGSFAHHINSNGAISYNASYNGTVSEGNFGPAGALLQTNGSGSPPSWVSSIVLSSINASVGSISSLNASTMGSFTTTNIAASGIGTNSLTTSSLVVSISDFNNRSLLTVAESAVDYSVLKVNVNTSPIDRYLGIDVPGAAGSLMILRNSGSNVGIDTFPADGIKLDVNGNIRCSTINAGRAMTANQAYVSTISSATYLALAAANEVELVPGAGHNVIVNSNGVGGNGNGTIVFGNSEVRVTGYAGPETFVANNYYPGSYFGGWVNYTGQALRVEYGATFDSSFSGGLGKAEIVLPVGISTLASAQGAYVAFQDTSPGLTHPIWLFSTINDASGQISTVQFGGAQTTDAFFSILGYV